jgi:hypothetical protein
MFRTSLAFLIAVAISCTAQASVVSLRPFSAMKAASSPRERYTVPNAPASLGIVRMDALYETQVFGNTNFACVKAHVSRLTFSSLPKYSPTTNYCQVEMKDLPKDALALLEKVSEMNEKVATLLGQDVASTFPMDVEISINADANGSLDSEAQGGRIYMSALPDWTFKDFSSKIYAHEIIHTLTFNAGPTSRALLGLQEHPFLIEALPDLVSSTIHDSPQMELGEKDLPQCLRVIRDETPIRSMDAPFSRFYTLSGADDIVSCCATLDLLKVTPFTKALCNNFTNSKSDRLAAVETFVNENEIISQPYDATHLMAPFEAESCRITTATGLTYLDNCDTHQFAYPLVSFFFRLKELTGKSVVESTGRAYVTEFFGKIRDGSNRTAVYECGYNSTAVTSTLGGAKAYVGLRPLLGVFMAFRDVLSASEKSAFDRAWREHDFGKMLDLDRIYRNEGLPGIAQIAAREKNTLYRDLKGCGNTYKFDPSVCSVACEKKL